MYAFLTVPMRADSFAHIKFQKICLRIAPVSAITWARIAQLVQRLAAGWTVHGSNPGGCQLSRTSKRRP